MTASEEVEGEGYPICRRCGGRRWRLETRPKPRLRWWLELVLAAPEVILFHGESPGWPAPVAQIWTCLGCGRRVRT